MTEVLETAHVVAEKNGRSVTSNTGLRCKQMKAWRALGRTMCDIRLLVFNIGRSDFRMKHITPYATLVQVGTQSVVCTPQHTIDVSFDMCRSIGALLDMRAIVS